jgi:hypothetical protein
LVALLLERVIRGCGRFFFSSPRQLRIDYFPGKIISTISTWQKPPPPTMRVRTPQCCGWYPNSLSLAGSAESGATSIRKTFIDGTLTT